MQNQNYSISRRIGIYLSHSRFYTTSIVIHLILVGVLGGVVLFQDQRERSTFEMPGSLSDSGFLDEAVTNEVENLEEPPEFEETAGAAVETASTAQSTIQALAETQTWSAISTNSNPTFGNMISASRTLSAGSAISSSNQFGKGAPSGVAGKMKGSLFGVKIDSSKLGVILDVSGSAHPHLVAALDEIQASFENATIFLYPGCGMSAGATSEEYRVAKPHSMRDKFERMANTPTIYGTLAMWSKNHPNDQPRITKLLQSQDVYIMDTDSKTTCMVGCQFAFERLMQDKVDTIYWFADFGDTVDEGVASEMAKRLKAMKIRVIAHNFAGNTLSAGAAILVDKTGGKASFVQPGKQQLR